MFATGTLNGMFAALWLCLTSVSITLAFNWLLYIVVAVIDSLIRVIITCHTFLWLAITIILSYCMYYCYYCDCNYCCSLVTWIVMVQCYYFHLVHRYNAPAMIINMTKLNAYIQLIDAHKNIHEPKKWVYCIRTHISN